MSESLVPEVSAPSCPARKPLDLSQLQLLELHPQPPLPDYLAALQLAKAEAGRLLGDAMLLSWYDRDRDFEAPQHVSECHADSSVPGYVDYAIYRGATLKIDIEQGRFVLFFLAV